MYRTQKFVWARQEKYRHPFHRSLAFHTIVGPKALSELKLILRLAVLYACAQYCTPYQLPGCDFLFFVMKLAAFLAELIIRLTDFDPLR